jgi:hypothetical protein
MRAIGGAFQGFRTAATLGLMVGSIVAGAAWAEPKPAGIEGRWKLTSGHCGAGACKAFYDLSPCGDGWCGVEVEEGGKCGRTSIRLDARKKSLPDEYDFRGRFLPAKDADPYVVEANTGTGNDGVRTLWIYGHTGGQFQAFRRTFPLRMILERVAGAECHDSGATS